MTQRRFIQCDVFAATPTKGNALAVVVDGDGLSEQQMQDFAAWTNLAETTFLMPPTDPQADYKVRIFTPSYEMIFAGHPTLGSCASWLHTGGTPKTPGQVIQECGVGLVRIDISGDIPAFGAPPTEIADLTQAARDHLITTLDLDPAHVTRTALLKNGPQWQVLELQTAKQVLAVDASKVRWPSDKGVSLIGPYPEGSACQYEVRFISPSSGMSEDPITGSLNAALARWLLAQGRLPGAITVSQGTVLNRQGRVFIRPDDTDPNGVWIGGQTHIMIQGTLDL